MRAYEPRRSRVPSTITHTSNGGVISVVRMVLTNIVAGTPPLPSAVVLRPAQNEVETNGSQPVNVDTESDVRAVLGGAIPNVLPISVGAVEASCIVMSADKNTRPKRPMTHELLLNSLEVMGGTLESVSLVRVEGTTFYATLDVRAQDGATHAIDARPSDAIALALYADAPILASEDVLERAGLPDFSAIRHDEQERELSEFHDFVEGLSPEDFKAPDQK